MIDYDMPMLDFDIQDLKKKNLLIKDKEGNEFVKYKELLEEVKPKKIALSEMK